MASALLVGAGLAGCGGDDSQTLSKAAYVEQGDAICEAESAKVERETKDFIAGLEGDDPSAAELTTLVEDVVKPNAEVGLSKLRDLPVPAGDEDELDDIYEAQETELAKVENDPKLVIGESDPFAKSKEAAGRYGFKECSK